MGVFAPLQNQSLRKNRQCFAAFSNVGNHLPNSSNIAKVWPNFGRFSYIAKYRQVAHILLIFDILLSQTALALEVGSLCTVLMHLCKFLRIFELANSLSEDFRVRDFARGSLSDDFRTRDFSGTAQIC